MADSAKKAASPPPKGGKKGGKEKKDAKKGKKDKGKKDAKSDTHKKKKIDKHHFQLVQPIYWPLAALWLTALSTLDPDTCDDIPGLGPFMTDHYVIFALVFIFFAIVNFLSTIGVIILCRRNKLTGGTTLKWSLQTMVIGVPSFMRLRSGESAMVKKREQQQAAAAEAQSAQSKKGGKEKKKEAPAAAEGPPPEKPKK